MILEFGTLGGYSTIWLGRSLADGGRLVTLEADPDYAEVARENIARANLGGLVDLRVGLHLTYCPDWTPRGSVPSTSLSSTPIRRTARAISPGHWITPVGKPDRRRQRCPRWRPRGPRERSEGPSPAPPARDGRRGESGQRDDDPDGRRQGLRLIHDRSGVVASCWGKKWGKNPHRSQPIPADLDLAKTALDRAPRSPADSRFGLIIGPSYRNPKVNSGPLGSGEIYLGLRMDRRGPS